MKSIDDFPYAVIFAFFTALCFFFVSILLYRYKGQLIFMPMLGALMGYVAASVTLRRRKLGLSATMGEMKASIKKGDTNCPHC